MAHIYVDKSIEIEALPIFVWDALTECVFTDQWAPLLLKGDRESLRVESTWALGSAVTWKGPEGEPVLDGTVVEAEPGKLIRFTVSDVRSGSYPPVTDQDGVVFELGHRDARTILRVKHGDFSATETGQRAYRLTAESWEKVLVKIKELAEKHA